MEFHANEDIIELAKSINRMADSRTKPLDTIIERFKAELIDAHKTQSGKTQLIKQLQAELDKAYSYAKRLFQSLAPQCEPLSDMLGILTQIDNWGTQHRWIPVSERLPDRKGIYLVLWHNNKDGNTQLRTCEEYIFEKKDDWGFTHWKPIILP